MHYIQALLLLCGQVPNTPGLTPIQGPEVGDPCLSTTSHTLSIIYFSGEKGLSFTPIYTYLFNFTQHKDTTVLIMYCLKHAQKGIEDEILKTNFIVLHLSMIQRMSYSH